MAAAPVPRGVKRRAGEVDVGAVVGWSVSESVDYIAGFLPMDFADRDAILAALTAGGVDGATLLSDSFGEADLKEAGIKAFGRRKKIAVALKGLRTAATQPNDSDDATLIDDHGEGVAVAAGAAAPLDTPDAVLAMLAPAGVDATLDKERTCMATASNVVGNMLHALQSPRADGWTTAAIAELRQRELADLTARCALPSYSVVTVGNTGAGKSTLLNALLGETEVLPTNGMRACTAVLIEMRHDPDRAASNRDYNGEVEFVSKEEWAAELDDCLAELSTTDGRVVLHVSNPRAHNYGSWCKLFAVYGETFTHSSVWSGDRGPDGRKVYKAPSVDEMRRKLARHTALTCNCSTTKYVNGNSAAAFRAQLERYTDSANKVSEGSYWPLVRLVRVRSCRWAALRPGITLVDAPGLNDSNASRNAVVSRYLRDADAIWVVSNISRAVNDKTAKDLLSKDFRRQLLMDGKMSGALTFVATQTDLLHRSEVIKSLRLDRKASTEACAAARNTFTKRRVQADFYDGIAEMAALAGDDEVTRDVIETRYRLPVFTVSAVDFQKLAGIRPLDGAALWGAAAPTEVPALVRHLHAEAIARRAAAVRERAEAVVGFADGALLMCTAASDTPAAARAAAQAVFDEVMAAVPPKCAAVLDGYEAGLNGVFDTELAPSLADGAEVSEAAAMATVVGWGATMHWATYKATVRRGGVFRTDFNEELSAPILEAVSTRWEKTFCGAVTARLEAAAAEIQTELAGTLAALNARLAAVGVDRHHTELLRSVLSREVRQKFATCPPATATPGHQTELGDSSRGN